jgi:hypothetical protein
VTRAIGGWFDACVGDSRREPSGAVLDGGSLSTVLGRDQRIYFTILADLEASSARLLIFSLYFLSRNSYSCLPQALSQKEFADALLLVNYLFQEAWGAVFRASDPLMMAVRGAWQPTGRWAPGGCWWRAEGMAPEILASAQNRATNALQEYILISRLTCARLARKSGPKIQSRTALCVKKYGYGSANNMPYTSRFATFSALS